MKQPVCITLYVTPSKRQLTYVICIISLVWVLYFNSILYFNRVLWCILKQCLILGAWLSCYPILWFIHFLCEVVFSMAQDVHLWSLPGHCTVFFCLFWLLISLLAVNTLFYDFLFSFFFIDMNCVGVVIWIWLFYKFDFGLKLSLPLMEPPKRISLFDCELAPGD